MTSPARKRSDRSRKRLSQVEKLEIAERVKRCFDIDVSPGDYGANCAPLTRADCILIGKAVREDWDVPEAKRDEIAGQMLAALDSGDNRLALSVVRLTLAMEARNQCDL